VIPACVLGLLFPIAAVVGARGPLVGLSIGLPLLPVRGIIAALQLEDLLPVLEVVATALNRTTGFAAPTEAVPGPLSAIILGQGLALVAIGAGLRLQDCLGSFFLGGPRDLMPSPFCVPVRDQESGNRFDRDRRSRRPPKQCRQHCRTISKFV
jgi:hypothetical protein